MYRGLGTARRELTTKSVLAALALREIRCTSRTAADSPLSGVPAVQCPAPVYFGQTDTSHQREPVYKKTEWHPT